MTEAEPIASGNRVEYAARGSDAGDLVAWYVHGPLGVEQGFTLEEAPSCANGAARIVELEVALGGPLSPTMSADGSTVLLRDEDDRVVARYGDLYVVDAAHQELPADLTLRNGSVRIRFDTATAKYPVYVDPLLTTEQAKLAPSDLAISSGLGASVAASNDTLIVGAPGDDDNGFNSGSAYIYGLGGGATWTQQAKLVPSDGVSGAGFGISVAISGDTVLVGAFSDYQLANNDGGSAYVFVRNGGVWTQQAKLLVAGSNGMGFSVAIDGDRALIGDLGFNWFGGAVYAFERSGGVWTLQTKLYGSQGDFFGYSVALEGTTALIGASSYVHVGVGAAFVFGYANGSWSQQAELNTNSAGYFGESVGLSGDTAVVSNRLARSAHTFARTNGVWTEQGVLVSDSSQLSDDFGSVVSISDDTVVVGSSSDDDAGASSGAAYQFVRTGGTWSVESKLQASDADVTDYLGGAVAVVGSTAFVGATGDDDIAPSSGALYLYDLASTVGLPCVTGSTCGSGFCVDGVCCSSACDEGPCDACSIAAGASADGVCTPFSGIVCDDEDACTLSDTCQNGVCVGTNNVVCAAVDDCHPGVCDPVSGLCDNPAAVDGSLCDDGDACTLGDSCLAGVCTAAGTMACAPLDECHDAGVCDPISGTCDDPPKPDNSPCDDGDACTLGDICLVGACTAAGTVDCAPLDECHDAGVCDPSTGACDSPPKPDGTPCSLGACQQGICEPPSGAGGAGGASVTASGSASGGSSSSGGGGFGAEAAGGDGTNDLYVEGGCQCTSTPASKNTPWVWLSIAALAVALQRRRVRGKRSLLAEAIGRNTTSR